MTRRTLFLLASLAACSDRSAGSGEVSRPVSASDSAYSQVQTRGQAAMGVDQYTSTHHFEPLPNGGLITLERDVSDSAGIIQIRAHMKEIAQAFGRGDFAIPGFVHDRNVPGTAIMAARRSRIRYQPVTLSRGGSLRITSDDPVAVAAIHEFLAFQRRDHRASHEPGTH